MKDLLIVIDMQNDFICGSLGTPEAQAIVRKVATKIRNWDGDVIATQDTHSKNYLDTREGYYLPVEHCIIDTWGWELHDLIKDAIQTRKDKVNILAKDRFGLLSLADCAYGYNSITLVGLCTDVCVISNALIVKNAYPEKDIYVDSFCCAGVTPAKHEAALEVMRSCQIEVY